MTHFCPGGREFFQETEDFNKRESYVNHTLPAS